MFKSQNKSTLIKIFIALPLSLDLFLCLLISLANYLNPGVTLLQVGVTKRVVLELLELVRVIKIYVKYYTGLPSIPLQFDEAKMYFAKLQPVGQRPL